MKKRIYIAGPISSGDLLHNIRQADEAFFALLRAGFAPFCPHWSVFAGEAHNVCTPAQGRIVRAQATVLPHGTTHDDWMGVDLPWVSVADGVLRLPGVSVGADREVRQAEAGQIPVFQSVNDVVSYFRFASELAA
jgi:hypothetical protein